MSIEDTLRKHAHEHNLPITIIRTGHPFGPNVRDTLTYDSFRDAFRTKKFLWVYRNDLPYQYCYTADIAHLAQIATDDHPSRLVNVLHLGGYDYSTALDFGHDIVRHAHDDPSEYARQRLISAWAISLVCLAKPEAKRGVDIRRNFEHSFLLDDTETHAAYPDFTLTPKDEAIRMTLAWHREFTLK
jgi:nucleoside-diphosphate-sugar epimerase